MILDVHLFSPFWIPFSFRGMCVACCSLDLIEVIMAQEDRWTLKILSLPVFSDEFSSALLKTPLANLAFVHAVDVKSESEFVDKVVLWSQECERDVSAAVCSDPLRLGQFWRLACSAEKGFLQSTVFQLGFGLGERSVLEDQECSVAWLRKSATVAPLVKKVVQPLKRAKTGDETSSSNTPLLDQENAVKAKWAARLEAMGRRAGVHSKLLSDQESSHELAPGEAAKLRKLVLSSGAPRTMIAHVRAMERFERWAGFSDLEPFPLTAEKVLKYALHLDARDCGPTVLPSLKTSIKWVAARLAMEVPNLDDRRLRALQEKIVADRAKMLKEAVPIPLVVVGALEGLVLNEAEGTPARIFIWWILCMIFASLRFDDAVHVNPADLKMKDEGLFGVAWQTKVDRKRVGTRFVVPKVGFSQSGWLEVGWDLLSSIDFDRDFWVPELNTRSEFIRFPPTYARSVKWLKVFVQQAIVVAPQDAIAEEQKTTLIRSMAELTAHSCRVTLLDAAVHAGRSTEEIGLQANWKNPGPLVLKCTRNRTSVPATMIKQLVRDLTTEDHFVKEDQDTMLTDVCDQELDGVQFFIKTPAPGSYYDYKYHCSPLGDPESIACGRFEFVDCTAVGSDLPDISALCKSCARHRPDIVRMFEPSCV